MKKERKVLIFTLFIFTTLLVNLFLLSAKDPLGITNNLDPDLAEFLISLLPIVILLIISFIMVKSGKRGLITLQIFMWYLYTFYIILKITFWADIYFDWQLPLNNLENIVTIPEDTNYYPWFLISLFINLAVSMAMSLKNNSFIKSITQ